MIQYLLNLDPRFIRSNTTKFIIHTHTIEEKKLVKIFFKLSSIYLTNQYIAYVSRKVLWALVGSSSQEKNRIIQLNI